MKIETDLSLVSILEYTDKLNQKINFCGDEQEANKMEEELIGLKDDFQELASRMLDPLEETLVTEFGREKVRRGPGDQRVVSLEVAKGTVSFISPNFHGSFGTQKGFGVLFTTDLGEKMTTLPSCLHTFKADALARDMVEWAQTELPMILIAL